MTGIDVDVCHAVAAAVFGDASKVKFSQLTAKERFTALQSGEVDVISRNTTWTSSRDSGMGLVFTGVTYYDGIGFLVNNKLGVTGAKQLDGATVCIQAGTTTELNVSDYFRTNGMKYTPITFDTADESAKGLESGDISPVAANAFANLMGKGLSSYKLQMEYAKALGKTPTIVALMPEPERGRDVKPRSDS